MKGGANARAAAPERRGRRACIEGWDEVREGAPPRADVRESGAARGLAGAGLGAMFPGGWFALPFDRLRMRGIGALLTSVI